MSNTSWLLCMAVFSLKFPTSTGGGGQDGMSGEKLSEACECNKGIQDNYDRNGVLASHFSSDPTSFLLSSCYLHAGRNLWLEQMIQATIFPWNKEKRTVVAELRLSCLVRKHLAPCTGIGSLQTVTTTTWKRCYELNRISLSREICFVSGLCVYPNLGAIGVNDKMERKANEIKCKVSMEVSMSFLGGKWIVVR